jgi:hypothetical protein
MELISRTKGSNLGRELKIDNGAANEYREGRKKERDEEDREMEELLYSAW